MICSGNTVIRPCEGASLVSPIEPEHLTPDSKIKIIRSENKIISLIKKIWQIIVRFFTNLKTCVAKPLVLQNPAQKKYINSFHIKNLQSQSYFEKLYFHELQLQVSLLKKRENPEDLLRSIDETSNKFEELTSQTSDKIDALIDQLQTRPTQELLEIADELYQSSLKTLEELKQLPGTNVQRAAYSGRLVALLRKLDDAFSDKLRETLHRYCGCHIKTQGDDQSLKMLAPGILGKDKFLVEHQKQEMRGELPQHTSAVLFSQSYGGGHNVVQHAISQRIAERGGHAYKIEADVEVFEAYYNYRKWTGYSSAEWSQWLLKNNHFTLIRLLGWVSSGPEKPEVREAKINCFALSLLSRAHTDLAITCFQRNSSTAEKASSRLGQAHLEIGTDLDYQVFDFQKDVENPHYRHGVMARDVVREARVLNGALEPEQIVEVGFSVRDVFLKHYTQQELLDIRTHYNQTYNLAFDARVVVLLCGGEGVSNTMAETLAKRYSKEGPKIHLFAICGKNEQKKEVLDAYFRNLNRDNFQATAFGWTAEKELGELFAMGALEENKGLLISAKAGGGTLSEAIARGIPALVSEMSGIPHEQRNLDFLVEKQLGRSFKKERELPEKVLEMLTAPFNPQVAASGEHYANYRSKEKSILIIKELVENSRKDAAFQERREKLSGQLPAALEIEDPLANDLVVTPPSVEPLPIPSAYVSA